MAFWSDPMKTLARDIDAAKANLSRLRTKLAECEATITERRAQAMQLARDDAEDGALDKAEAAIRSAQDRRETISGAIADVESKLAALEKTFAENTDRALREQTAKEFEQSTRRSVDDGDAFVKAAARWVGSLTKLAPVVPEAGALLHLLQVCTAEAPPTSDRVAQLARAYRDAVLRGHAAATLPVPPEAYAAPAAPAGPPTMTLFCLGESVKWIDDAGKLHCPPKFTDVTLPLKQAKRALELKACVPLDHPARKTHGRTVGGQGDPALAIDLDAEPERRADPILASQPPQFVPFDRGPATVLKIATPRL
jgi:hypothetical protein